MKSGEEQRGRETLGLYMERDGSLTGSSRVTMRWGHPSRLQCRTTGFPRCFRGEDRAQGKRDRGKWRYNTGAESEDVSRQEQDTSSSILKGLA